MRGSAGTASVVLVILATVCLTAARAEADEPYEPHEVTIVPPVVLREHETELGFVPIIGGDSDIGLGVGELSALARLDPPHVPYAWRLESGAMITFKPTGGATLAGLRIPYQDYYFLLTVPDLLPRQLRLEIRPAFTDETTQNYSGVGNASPPTDSPPGGQDRARYYEYGRIHPSLSVKARLTLSRRLFVEVANAFTYSVLDVHPGSKLARDMSGDAGPDVKSLVGSPAAHAVDFFEQALEMDDRDDETSTHRGQWHQLKVRVSPGGTEVFPYRYAQATGIVRFYTSPVPRYLTLALRLVGDFIVGVPPFYELTRFSDDTPALGGAKGVRGVPGQRYYGKIKVFGNLEARSEILPFKLFSKQLLLGAAVFFDGGRLWADWTAHPELDGTGVGLKYGVGGGLRLQEGQTFLVRADLAWSPDARPVGAYFGAGQMF